MKRVFDAQLIGPFAAMMIVAVIVALTTERFLNPGNLSNLFLQVLSPFNRLRVLFIER